MAARKVTALACSIVTVMEFVAVSWVPWVPAVRAAELASWGWRAVVVVMV